MSGVACCRTIGPAMFRAGSKVLGNRRADPDFAALNPGYIV
jgi:hypothetical protein